MLSGAQPVRGGSRGLLVRGLALSSTGGEPNKPFLINLYFIISLVTLVLFMANAAADPRQRGGEGEGRGQVLVLPPPSRRAQCPGLLYGCSRKCFRVSVGNHGNGARPAAAAMAEPQAVPVRSRRAVLPPAWAGWDRGGPGGVPGGRGEAGAAAGAAVKGEVLILACLVVETPWKLSFIVAFLGVSKETEAFLSWLSPLYLVLLQNCPLQNC